MKKIILTVFIICCTYAGFSQGKQAYIKQYTPLAKELSASYGIPPSVIVGIAIIESGFGKSRNCKLLKNHFGIIGKNNLRKTKGVKSRFKQYESDEASYRDFARLVSTKKYYKKLKGNTDWKVWIDTISKSGYAERPAEWKRLMTSSIKNNKLYKMDEDMIAAAAAETSSSTTN